MNGAQFLGKARKRKLTKEQIDKKREEFLKEHEVNRYRPLRGKVKYLPGNKNPISFRDRMADKADRLLGRESEQTEGIFHKQKTTGSTEITRKKYTGTYKSGKKYTYYGVPTYERKLKHVGKSR